MEVAESKCINSGNIMGLTHLASEASISNNTLIKNYLSLPFMKLVY